MTKLPNYSFNALPIALKTVVNIGRNETKSRNGRHRPHRGADGWAKNQLGERRLGELFFGRQTIWRQQSFQKRRFAERRLGDKGMQFVFLLASIISTSSAVTHWMQSSVQRFSSAWHAEHWKRTRCLVAGS